MKIDITYDSSVNPSNFSGGATEEAAFKADITYDAEVETIIPKRRLCGARHKPRYVELRIMRSCVRAR